jgi:transposase
VTLRALQVWQLSMRLFLVSVTLHKLAELKDEHIRASCTSIAAALSGDYRPELVFILSQELGLYKFYQTQITECDAQIDQCLAQFTDKVDVKINLLGKPKRRGKKQPGNAPQSDLRTHLYRITGVDFTQINGLGALTVLVILSEVGLDPSRFPTVKHFVSWLGLCPGSRVTGGKVKSSKTRPVINRAANAFRMAAQTLCRSNSALGGFYRRMQSRMGALLGNYCCCSQTRTHFLPSVDIRSSLCRPRC